LKDFTFGDKASVFIMDQNGIVLSSTDTNIPENQKFNQNGIVEQIISSSSSKETKVYSFYEYKSEKYFFFKKIDGVDWIIVGIIPISDIQKQDIADMVGHSSIATTKNIRTNKAITQSPADELLNMFRIKNTKNADLYVRRFMDIKENNKMITIESSELSVDGNTTYKQASLRIIIPKNVMRLIKSCKGIFS